MCKYLILLIFISTAPYCHAKSEGISPLPDIGDELTDLEDEETAEDEISKEEANKAVVGGSGLEAKEVAPRKQQVKQVIYKWGIPEGLEYDFFLVEIYKDNQLKNLIRKAKANKNQITINLKEDEVNFIRIAIKTKDGLVSDFSNLSKVVFTPEIEIKKVPKSKYAMGIFYAASTGHFEETGATGVQIVEDQNSPLTLGVNASYPMNDKWTMYSSLYLSYFSEIQLSLSSEAKSPPIEYGFNAYAQTKSDIFGLEGFYYYGGIDFENFTTFNTDQLTGPNSLLEFRSQNLFYLTVGLQKNFTLFDRFSFVKFSASPVLLSSGDENPVNGEVYSGFKYILYVHHSLWQRWGTGFFYKQHLLSGAGDLTITRYGINFSYRLF